MRIAETAKPTWLTFDCYGTLIQWDEGLIAAVRVILGRHPETVVEIPAFMSAFDRCEHELERERPHRSFREVTAKSLERTMGAFGMGYEAEDSDRFVSGISAMPPFPEVVGALAEFKRMGFKLCIVSNTDDGIIAGNVAQLGGHIDRVVTAEQAQAYKPSAQIFAHAHRQLGVTKDEIVHICASPQLDLVAAREIGFRCVWIDRGTGRKAPAGYQPDAIFSTLAPAPGFFAQLGWGIG